MKTIILYPDSAGPRRWLLTAKARLAAAGYEVSLAPPAEDRGDATSANALRVCEWIDGIVNGDRGRGLAARIAGEAVVSSATHGEMAPAGVTVEVRCHDSGQSARQYMQLLYDGAPGDEALFAALLERRSPRIEIVDADSGCVLAAGIASLASARSLLGSAEAVYACVVTLLEVVLRSPRGAGMGRQEADRASGRISPSHVFRQLGSGLLQKPVRAAYEALCHFPHWRVGSRLTSGASVWEPGSMDASPWRVLADPGDHFYADPFPISWRGRRMIFVEDFDHRRGKGTIAAVDVRDDGSTGAVLQAVDEPWHLSYPFMIEDGGELWMIPESSSARTVDLYRAERFPDRWVKEATLLSGIDAADATVVRHGGAFWMFASVRDAAGSGSDTLCIFKAAALAGPWTPHALNPVLVDAGSARPAGNMVLRDGLLWRPAQVCDRSYGAAVALCEVTRLDDGGFEQVVRRVLRPGPTWPGRRLHTLNEGFGIACIDGWAASPRNPLLARLLEPWCLRRSE